MLHLRMLVVSVGVAALPLIGGCAEHSKKDLMRQTNVSMTEAIKTAESSVPRSRAVEAELEHENGRTVYEIELLDANNDEKKIWVDAYSGKITKVE